MIHGTPRWKSTSGSCCPVGKLAKLHHPRERRPSDGRLLAFCTALVHVFAPAEPSRALAFIAMQRARPALGSVTDGRTDGGICTSTNLINTRARTDGDARTHSPCCFCRTTPQKTSCRNLPEPSWTPPRQSSGAPPLHLSSSPPHLLSSSSLHLIILTPSTHLSILVLSSPPPPAQRGQHLSRVEALVEKNKNPAEVRRVELLLA